MSLEPCWLWGLLHPVPVGLVLCVGLRHIFG